MVRSLASKVLSVTTDSRECLSEYEPVLLHNLVMKGQQFRYLLLSLFICLLIACSTPDQATPLKTGFSPWPGFAGIYAASDRGFYADENIEVKENFFQTASDVNTAFLADQLDLAWTGGPDAVILASQEPSLRVILLSDYSNGADGILARGISKPEDLKGQEIAWENLPLQALLLHKYLNSVGLTEADVKLRNITAAEAASAFAAQKIDAAVTYEPWLSKASQAGQGTIIFSSKNTNLIPGVLVAKESFIQEHQDDIIAYMRAFDRGVDFVRENSEEAAQIVAQKLGVTPEEIPPMLETLRLFDAQENQAIIFNPNDPLNVMDSLKFAAQVSQEMELIDQSVDADKLYDDSLVKAL